MILQLNKLLFVRRYLVVFHIYFMFSYSSSFSWDSGRIYAETGFSGNMALILEGSLSINTFISISSLSLDVLNLLTFN